MIEMFFDTKDRVRKWVARRLDCKFNKGDRAFGILKDGKLIAGIVSHKYTDSDVFLAIASISPDWCNRKILYQIYSYVFNQCKCDRTTAITEIDNKKAITMLKKLGYKEEGMIRKAINKKDAYMFGMLREECKWLRGNNG